MVTKTTCLTIRLCSTWEHGAAVLPLSGLPGWNNNPQPALRIVSAALMHVRSHLFVRLFLHLRISLSLIGCQHRLNFLVAFRQN